MRLFASFLPALALMSISATASALSLSAIGVTDTGVGATPGFTFSTNDIYRSGYFYASAEPADDKIYAQFYGDGLPENGQLATVSFGGGSYDVHAGGVRAVVLNGFIQSITGSFFELSASGGAYNHRAYYNFSGLSYTTRDEYYPTNLNDSSTVYSEQQSTGHFAVALAPVPEPATYALMLVGLAAVGGVARRRKS